MIDDAEKQARLAHGKRLNEFYRIAVDAFTKVADELVDAARASGTMTPHDTAMVLLRAAGFLYGRTLKSQLVPDGIASRIVGAGFADGIDHRPLPEVLAADEQDYADHDCHFHDPHLEPGRN